jgi:magnesium chelatase family protein
MIQHYRARLSGPLLDRIDMHLDVPAVRYRELSAERGGEASTEIRERCARARLMQRERFAARAGIFANAHMAPRDIRVHCQLTAAADALLRTAIARLSLSARAYHRVLKLARTIADLALAARIEPPHVSEAIQYRSLDRAPRG